jgi:hypothetical protein
MCRSIKQLRLTDREVTDVEVMEAARQYVRKVSGFRKPSKANEAAFEQAIADIAEVTQALLDSLVVKAN